MTPHEVLQIGERLGVPAAIVLVCLFFSFVVLRAVIAGCKWAGERTLGETGFFTAWCGKQIELIDGIKESNDRQAESLSAIKGCLDSFREAEKGYHTTRADKLEAIHADVRIVKGHVVRWPEKSEQRD